MAGGSLHALSALHHAFRRRPFLQRAHIVARFLSAPFLRLAGEIPGGSRLLDIGAGHGLLAVLARERGARVVGVEPDVRKLRRIDGVQLIAGYDEVVRGTFDVVTIVDVLYKIPIEEWDAFLGRAQRRLRPAGMLLIKEHDPTARIKHGWNRFQESLASRLRMTLGQSFSYEAPADFTARLQRLGFRDVTSRRIDRGYPHAHILYTARKPL